MNDILDQIEINVEKIKISNSTLDQWQQLLDMLVEFFEVQDALINNYQAPYLKVTKGSSNSENLFSEGTKLKVKGLYCEDVIKEKKSLEVNNAAVIKKWESSIYMENGLIAYLGYPILWPNGEIYGTICIHDNHERNFDNSLKKRIEFIRDLIENNLGTMYNNHLNSNLRQYYSKLIDVLPVGVMIEDADGKILKVNKVMEKITGYSKQRLLKSTVFETLVPEDQKEIAKENIERILKGEVLTHELPSVNSRGEKCFIRLQERKITLPNNEDGIISIQTDVTDKIINEEKIRYAGYHDSLTDLYNRYYLEKEIQSLNQASKLPIALIMADLNGLKLVNDTYGHNEGDRLLQKMADILKSSCRDNDLIARWGGDEFVILLPETNSEAAKKIIKRINKKISNTFLKFDDGSKLPLSAALGYGIKKHLFEDIFEILDEAESKMYKNKLTESRSIKSNIVNTLLKTLSEKSQGNSFKSDG
jgi:diguanylate cyclase (GGDEF)-like protein/PAS domain S-box-containing protein